MTSSCNRDTLLDAARTCVLSFGVRRTTLTDIARRAGVSRMTLYRRFSDVTSVMAALMTREFTELLGDAAKTASGQPDARRALVTSAVAGVRALWTNPLMTSVLEHDPELLLPYLVERIGSTQRLIEEVLVEQVGAGHRDGSIRAGDPDLQARAIFLTAQAFVVSHRPATAEQDGDALLTELATILDRSLAA